MNKFEQWLRDDQRSLHELAVACPDIIFLAFTRAWLVPSMRAGLYEYAALENVRVLCSIDFTHQDRPPREGPVDGKRLKRAYVEGCNDAPKANCRKQQSKGATCVSCAKCWKASCGDVTLEVHGANAIRWAKGPLPR